MIATCTACFFQLEILTNKASEIADNVNEDEKDKYYSEDLEPLLDMIESEFLYLGNSIINYIILILVIVIPNFIIIIAALLQFIARLIYSESKYKACINLTYVSLVLLGVLCLLWIPNVFKMLIAYLPLVINVICMILFIIELRKMKKINTEIKTEVIEDK